MTALSIQPTFPIFTDIDGQPLEDGYVWIGTANLNPITNPITAYWDAALTLTAAQPIRTRGGYPINSGTPARLYVNSDYSIQVQNKNGSVVYSAPAATDRFSDVVVQDISSTEVTFLQAGTSAVTRTAQGKMRDTVSVKDFGAVGDGVTNDTAAIQAALTYANSISTGAAVYVPSGTYLCSAQLNIYPKTLLFGAGKSTSKLQFTHTGVGIKATSPLNSSTAVYIGLRDIHLNNNSGASTDGGFVDVGGTFVDVDNIRIDGFKHSIIFDQTEVSTITNCVLVAGVADGSCIWLANGNYTAGASLYYTNRITITANQLNAVGTALANIISDGGVNHSIRDNNLNAGVNGIRASGCFGLVISGNESEAHSSSDIYLADTTSTGTSVEPCYSPDISGNVLISNGAVANINMQSSVGGNITSNNFGQAGSAINLLGGASNKAVGVIIEGNTKIVTGAARTASPFFNGFSTPLNSQVVRQSACTYVSSSQAAGTITVTPASMEFIYPGTKLVAANEDKTNFELVVVKSTTSTTFSAIFATTKAANYVLTGVSVSSPTSGTFTPAIAGFGTAGVGTYTTQSGSYTRVGNCVYFSISLVWTAHTGTGNMFVSGLPFTADAASPVAVSCLPSSIALTAGNYLTAAINAAKSVDIYQIATGTTALSLVPIDTTGTLYLAGVYFTSEP
jgi:hypothetical protein